jgi:hypothetical protein
MSRSKTPIVAGLFSLALATTLSTHVYANSRFTVKNDSEARVSLTIFNGGDKICLTGKEKQLSPGEEGSYGCDGNGKQRCKAGFEARYSGGLPNKTLCKDIGGGCGVHIANGGELVINSDQTCTRTNPE